MIYKAAEHILFSVWDHKFIQLFPFDEIVGAVDLSLLRLGVNFGCSLAKLLL